MNENESDIGEVIAFRKLLLRRDAGDLDVCITLGKPTLKEDSGHFSCPYNIEIAGKKKVAYGYGIDGFQSIQLAMQRIGIDLANLKRTEGGEFIWSGGEADQTGFPFPPAI